MSGLRAYPSVSRSHFPEGRLGFSHYFPADSLQREFFTSSSQTTTCPWKGEASYYHVQAGGKANRDAAWCYPSPKAAAAEIAGRVAFWRGVEVRP